MQKIGDITPTADANGEWTNGSVAGGTPPTIIDATWLNTVQRELINVLKAAGITPDPTKDNQVITALTGYFLQAANNLSEIKASGATAQGTARTNIGAAALAGLASQLFSVATATGDDHAVNLAQIKSMISELFLGSASKANVGTGAGQIPDMSSFVGSNGQNGGYVKFPDGTIIQRGFTAGGVIGSPIDTAFPIPFTSTNYSVVATSDQAKPGSTIVVNFATQVLNTAAFRIMQNTNTPGYAAYWMAIGK